MSDVVFVRSTSILEHLVVGVDGSEGGRRALDWAACQGEDRPLTVVHGFSPGLELLAGAAQINLDPVRVEHGKLLTTVWSEPARARGVRVDTALIDDNAAGALLYVAERDSADAIVIGHQGHGRWSEHHVGDTAGRLLHRCDIPLILTNDTTEPERLSGTVVVGLSRPTDHQNPDLTWAVQLAEQYDLSIRLVSVVEPLAYIDGNFAGDMSHIHTELRQQLDALVDRLRTQHETIEVLGEVCQANAVYGLADAAKNCDACMVVVGTHHPGRLAGFFAGSVARLLPPLLTCPMVAIPAS